jgi:hypothetical protein
MRAKRAPPAGKHQKFEFSATLSDKPGAWVTVVIPKAIIKAIGARGAVPIVGVFDGKERFRSSLLATRDGVHILPVKYHHRKNLGLSPGDRIRVAFQVDHEPRTMPTPPDVIDALESEGLLDAYELVPPGRKRQFLIYLEQAVHEETRLKRIAMIVEMTHADREKRSDRELRKKIRKSHE